MKNSTKLGTTLKLSDRMYSINANLSLLIALYQSKYVVTQKNLIDLNKKIGEWIKEVRELEDNIQDCARK
jgi:cell division protein FtsL